jgi:hypothetical protein
MHRIHKPDIWWLIRHHTQFPIVITQTVFWRFILSVDEPGGIKHYLRLNGQFVAFNVDRNFCDAVDGLVVVGLMKTETRLLDRFMGKDGRRFYREYWSAADRRQNSR